MPAPKPTLLTAEAFFEGGARYDFCELWDGTVFLHDPSGAWSGAVGSDVHFRLAAHVRERRLGLVLGAETGFVVARRPDRVLVPDVAFVRRERLAGRDLSRFFEGAPDFAVEVRSRTDRWPGVLQKAGIWIAHGVEVVWAVDPESETVEVFRRFAPPESRRGDDLASAEPVLPEFSVRAGDLFVRDF